MKQWILLGLLAVAVLSGCAAMHRADVQDDSSDRVTVGTVQKEIRVGMSGAEVSQILGSPNIVSTDEERREAWIYDKIATDVSYSTSSSGLIPALLFGAQAGASSQSQRTLTVVIKFDNEKRVRDFSYHTSRF